MSEIVMTCPSCHTEWVFSDEEVAALKARDDIEKEAVIDLTGCPLCNIDGEEACQHTGRA